jgi:hypothetical protein
MMFETILRFLGFELCFRCEMKFTSRTSQGMSLLKLRDIWFRVWLSMRGLHASFYNLFPPTRTTTSYRTTLKERESESFLGPLEIEVDVQPTRRYVLDKNCGTSNSVSGSTPTDEHISTSAADHERATESADFH